MKKETLSLLYIKQDLERSLRFKVSNKAECRQTYYVPITAIALTPSTAGMLPARPGDSKMVGLFTSVRIRTKPCNHQRRKGYKDGYQQ